MRHFGFLTEGERARIFAVAPGEVGPSAPDAVRAVALGATVYSPGTRPALEMDARRLAGIGATSHVWCLEDAIGPADVPHAEAGVVAALRRLDADEQPVPALFVRVREAGQLSRVVEAAGGAARALSGVVLPKFGAESERELDELAACSERLGVGLLAMPVLETPELAWMETRRPLLEKLRRLVDAHREQVLAMRVGGSDLSGLFGLRRAAATTIWEVAVVRDALADILNVFARCGEHVVSGPVWEHLPTPGGLFRPRLRITPFRGRRALELRDELLAESDDELLREVAQDMANGMTGKTVIHPAHVGLVNAMLCVRADEHADAVAVTAAGRDAGAARRGGGTTMTEAGPHALWAELVLRRAAVYGVLAADDSVIELIAAGRAAVARAFPAGSPAVAP